MFDLTSRGARFDAVVQAFVERVADDRTVLAVVRLGSGRPETLWDSDSVGLWVVIADGTQPRRKADGDSPRVWRTFVEDDVDVHVELIERSKFKRMVEGNDRNTTSFSYFSVRTLVHCADDGIERWFDSVNTPAARDQQHDLLSVACWVADCTQRIRRRLEHDDRLYAVMGDAMELAHAVGVLAILHAGEIVEHRWTEKAKDLQPELMKTVHTDVLAQRSEAAIRAAADAADAHLAAHWEPLFEPIGRFLDRFGGPVPLSELSEHFATSALHARQLSSACEWMVRLGRLTKLSAPMPVTKKSRVRLDEPAYTRA